MFARNEYVFHESGGICRIDDIRISPLDSMPPNREYYIAKPLHDPSSVIYIPVDSDRIFMRRLLSRAEAEALLERIPFVRTIEEPNAKLLRAKYVEAMRTHDPLEWVRRIKAVYLRANAQSAKPNRLSETERSFFESAKRFLHAELALALELPEQNMEQYITDYIQNMA